MKTIKVTGRFGVVGQIEHCWLTDEGESGTRWYSITAGGHGTPTMTSLTRDPSPEQIERKLSRLETRIRETANLYGR